MPHVAEGQLHAYLDGELAALGTSADEVERHLAECTVCRERLRDARTTRERASAILAASGPAKVEIPPFEAIAGRTTHPARRRRVSPTSLAWAATIVLALGLGWSLRTLLTPGSRVGGDVTRVPESVEQAPVALSEPSPAPGSAVEETAAEGASVRSPESGVRQSFPSRAEPEPPAAKGFQNVAPPPHLADAAPSPAVASASRAERQRAREAVAEDFSGIGAAAPAAPATVISGRVTDETGMPLPGTTIRVPSANAGATTGEDGRYEVAIPAERIADSAALTVQVAKLGYEARSATLALVPGSEAERDFRLPTSAVSLEGIVATGAGSEAGKANDAETPRVLAAAIRHLRARLSGGGQDIAFAAEILACEGERCTLNGGAGEWSSELGVRVRRDADVAEQQSAAKQGTTTRVTLSRPRIDDSSATVSAWVDPWSGAPYAVRLDLRRAGLRWRVTGERRLPFP